MEKFIKKILIDEEKIQGAAARLGAQISKDYEDKNLLVVGVLKGAFVFTADLLKKITIPCEIDFVSISSYIGTQRQNEIIVKRHIDYSLENHDVLVVEDLLESGCTMKKVIEQLEVLNPRSVSVCVIMDKPRLRKVDIHANYVGFEIPDDFVVGYGLDYDQKFRNLPYIGVLDAEKLKSGN